MTLSLFRTGNPRGRPRKYALATRPAVVTGWHKNKSGLTKRQYEAATLVHRGLSNDDIAVAMICESQNVSNLLCQVYTKLEIETGSGGGSVGRVQLALMIERHQAPFERAA